MTKKGVSLKTVDQAFRVHGFDVRKTINTEEMSLKQLADMDDVNLEKKTFVTCSDVGCSHMATADALQICSAPSCGVVVFLGFE